MASEIREEEDQNLSCIQDKEAEKIRIRQIIDYQKSLYFSASCSSFSSAAASTSSSKSSSLLDLMKEGSTSLRRLFDMEHTSLGTYFTDYSVSPIIKPILLWGSETDNDEVHDDPWAEVKQIGGDFGSRIGDQDRVISSLSSCNNEEFMQHRKRGKMRKQKLIRTKSYKRLPGFSLWRCGRFKFKLRLIRKLRVLIKGRIF